MHDRLSLIGTLVAKDWQLFLADRRAAALGFLVPIVLASVFGMIFHKSPGKSSAPSLPVLIVADHAGPFTARVVEDLRTSPRLEVEIVRGEEMDRRIADRRPGVGIVFPPEFERLAEWSPLDRQPPPKVRIVYHPLAESESQWAEGLVAEIGMKRVAKERMKGFSEETPPLPFVLDTAPRSTSKHETFNSYSHSFNGMTLQYLLFWGMECGLLFLRERQRSLWLRLRAAPVPLATLLIGKAASTASIAFLQILTTFLFGWLVFGVTIGGSVVGFLILAVTISALSASTGLLVAALGGTEARGRNISILVILGVSMLGGLWLPSFVLPGWARDLAVSLPTTWAMRGLDAMTWQGRGLGAALPAAGVVSAFTVAFLILAVAKLVSSEARRRRGLT